MLEALFNQTQYVAAKKSLDATALRFDAIANNLANLETPNYKRVDLEPSFSAQMQQALASQRTGEIAALEPRLDIDHTAIANNRDGNSVELEKELLHLNEATTAHALETQLITGSLLRLRLAITGHST